MRYMMVAALALAAATCSRNVEVASTPNSAASVVSREWTLISLGDEAIPAGGRAITLRFDSSAKRISGYGPCNQYSGPYRMTQDSLHFGAIVSTKMACADNSRNVLEQAYFSALNETITYQVADSTLTLNRPNRKLARFRSR